MQNILKVVLGLFSVLFLVFGVSFLLGVEQMLEMFALDPEAAENTALAWSTVRGDMGGLFLTLGISIALGLLSGNRTWLHAAALLLGAIFIGRTIALAIHGGDQQIYVNMAGEAIGVALLLLYSRNLN